MRHSNEGNKVKIMIWFIEWSSNRKQSNVKWITLRCVTPFCANSSKSCANTLKTSTAKVVHNNALTAIKELIFLAYAYRRTHISFIGIMLNAWMTMKWKRNEHVHGVCAVLCLVDDSDTADRIICETLRVYKTKILYALNQALNSINKSFVSLETNVNRKNNHQQLLLFIAFALQQKVVWKKKQNIVEIWTEKRMK